MHNLCHMSPLSYKTSILGPGVPPGWYCVFELDIYFFPFPLKYIKENSIFKRYKYDNVDT